MDKNDSAARLPENCRHAGLAAVVFAVAIAMMSACAFAESPRQSRRILAINEDNDRYLSSDCAEDMTEKGALSYFDAIAEGKAVTHFFMCVNGQRTSYDSKVWEPIWLGIGECDEYGRTNHPWCVNAKLLKDRGVDLWKIWCVRAREKGISPWISMRMNDAHYADYPRKVHRNETFWWEHPELWRDPESRGKGGARLQAFDYSKRKVRERAMALVREILERWDADGIELDWMRQCKCLSPGKEREQAPILTAFIRDVKAECNAAAERRGHPVKVAVRVTTTLDGSLWHGFDVLQWARDGIVDIVIPSPEYWMADFDMDIPRWKRELNAANPSVLLLPCTDACVYGYEIHKDLALLRGWAANAAGGDGLYLFNATYYALPQRTAVYGGELLPERIVRDRRRFPITFHECAPPDMAAKQLSCNLEKGAELRVVATRGPYDSGARVIIVVGKPCESAPEIVLNGKRPIGASRLEIENVYPVKPRKPCEVFAWDFPVSTVSSGPNVVRVLGASSGATALWCEIELTAK